MRGLIVLVCGFLIFVGAVNLATRLGTPMWAVFLTLGVIGGALQVLTTRMLNAYFLQPGSGGNQPRKEDSAFPIWVTILGFTARSLFVAAAGTFLIIIGFLRPV